VATAGCDAGRERWVPSPAWPWFHVFAASAGRCGDAEDLASDDAFDWAQFMFSIASGCQVTSNPHGPGFDFGWGHEPQLCRSRAAENGSNTGRARRSNWT